MEISVRIVGRRYFARFSMNTRALVAWPGNPSRNGIVMEETRLGSESVAQRLNMPLLMDPGEKYFTDPLKRIEVSLDYAQRSASMKAELDTARK